VLNPRAQHRQTAGMAVMVVTMDVNLRESHRISRIRAEAEGCQLRGEEARSKKQEARSQKPEDGGSKNVG
jgi:hypothetical protein